MLLIKLFIDVDEVLYETDTAESIADDIEEVASLYKNILQ